MVYTKKALYYQHSLSQIIMRGVYHFCQVAEHQEFHILDLKFHIGCYTAAWCVYTAVVITSGNNHQGCSVRKGVLRNFAKFTGNTWARVSFLIKLQAKACNFIKKEALEQKLSCEFYDISKNTLFTEHLRTTASGLKKLQN